MFKRIDQTRKTDNFETNWTLKEDMSKDFKTTDPFQQRTDNDNNSDIETNDVHEVAPRGAEAPPTSPRQRPEEEMQRRQWLTDEDILRLLPKSQSTNQNVQRLNECKMKECTAVATKECSGYCTMHFCELYRSRNIDIPVPGSLKQAAAREYGDKSRSDEPGHPRREPARSVTRHTTSGSGGNSPRTPTAERRRRAKSTGRSSRPEGKSGSSSEGGQRPVACIGALCKNISYSGPLCDDCKVILKKAKRSKKPKGYQCAFPQCKKLSLEKGKLCKACHEILGEARAKEIPPPKPDEAYSVRRQPSSSSPLAARHRVDSPREDPLLRINTQPALQVMVNVGQVGPYHGARPRSGGMVESRHDPERRSRRHSTRDMDDRRHRHEEPHGSQRIQRYDEREPAMPNYHHRHRHVEREPAMPNYHHSHRHEETAYELHQRSNRNREEYGGSHDVRHTPSDIVTESPPSSFMSETNPSSVHDEESHPSLNALSINDWPTRNHRKNPGNEGNPSRNESGNEYSSVTDIPPRKRCENTKCENYGNVKCDGFCNSCYSRLRR